MEATDYGQELTCLTVIKKPSIMDTVVSGNHLFFIGRGRLWVADISEPEAPRIVGECRFRGTGRQITVRDGIAYITTRADGVYIIDVHDPAKPEMLCHYDCIELATGVEVQGDLLFVAQRQYGVEIVNVSDPRNPVYVSKIKTGEAQSVDARGDTIYVGDWGRRQLTTIDISDPYHPQIVNQYDLDGYGDGVCVAGEYLYASTGHHSRERGSRKRYPYIVEGDAGYGAGHGLEVFSLKDPRKPEFLGRTKFPKYYSRDGYDMWTPVAAGGSMVCCADTFNGVFLVDVSNPREPRTVARHHDLVSGVAVVDDVIYAACPKAGLKVLSAPSLVRHCTPDRGTPTVLPPAPTPVSDKSRIYHPGGQVWSVDFCRDHAVIAAGSAGVRVLELWPQVREIAKLETTGFAVHASIAGDRVYVSENTAGLSIWQHAGDGELQPLGRFQAPRNASVRQTMVYANGTRAVIQTGNTFRVLDVTDPANIKQIASHKVKIIYGDQMSHWDLGNRYAAVWGHVVGVRWLDFEASGKAINTGVNLTDRYSFFAGIAAVGDQFLCTSHGAYRLVNPMETDLDAKPAYRFGGRFLGKPTVFGNALILTSRVESALAIVDITDLQHPRLLREMPTAGNPSTVSVRNGALIIPDGNNGLVIYDDFVSALELDVDQNTFLGN
ncbi:MAG: hypothetical protein HN742_41615 [Lentisphaerae bacterium]|jgi:hypothetical protein|nr:hypothetical protein [Lentisphaerota bacterium]MBT4816042.1 hypothetical protein [Lentisphaerota bacterium]MBT5611727.1 hypothetical protein [Lentisphaerota bacterium]MBT7060433.1 hypothetical protein [Lentisphaerota bacterium]MBT7848436.1 hypothetical protein [Lentisphaerota bacterium]